MIRTSLIIAIAACGTAAFAQTADKPIDQVRKEFAELMEQRRMDREYEVLLRLKDGCTAMFKRDPDATITNRLCFDLFMDQGLPD